MIPPEVWSALGPFAQLVAIVLVTAGGFAVAQRWLDARTSAATAEAIKGLQAELAEVKQDVLELEGRLAAMDHKVSEARKRLNRAVLAYPDPSTINEINHAFDVLA